MIFLAFSGNVKGLPLDHQFQHIVDSIYAANPNAIGCAIHVEVPGKKLSWDYAVGYADKNKKNKLSPEQPVLIASNTKTYIATAVMRLVEQGKLGVDQPVEKLIMPKTASLLSGVGYRLDKITLGQLMSHTSGITDYVNDNYFETVNREKQRKWTRDEQIALAVSIGGPYANPGDSFRYADLNYLLLSEVLEKSTGHPFYEAVRSLLFFKSSGLNATWFVQLEKTPVKLPVFAHQYWNKYSWDSYELDPSWDLYGGGGIAATVKDMALFFQKLFDGKIIKDMNVLALMYGDVPAKVSTNYGYGLRKISQSGLRGYYHGGFWGTDVVFYPDLDASIAITVLEKSERGISAIISARIAELLK